MGREGRESTFDAIDSDAVFLGNSRSESDKFSLVVWIPSAAPRIDFLALRVARRELQ